MNTDTTTITGLMRLTRLSRERLKKNLENVEPVEVKSGVPHFDLGRALRAILNAGETAKARESRLRGDLLEARISRMKGEVLDRKACLAVWGDKLTRAASVVRGIDRLSAKEQKKICTLLRHEIDRIPDELNACTFPEFDDLDDGNGTADTDSD